MCERVSQCTHVKRLLCGAKPGIPWEQCQIPLSLSCFKVHETVSSFVWFPCQKCLCWSKIAWSKWLYSRRRMNVPWWCCRDISTSNSYWCIYWFIWERHRRTSHTLHIHTYTTGRIRHQTREAWSMATTVTEARIWHRVGEKPGWMCRGVDELMGGGCALIHILCFLQLLKGAFLQTIHLTFYMLWLDLTWLLLQYQWHRSKMWIFPPCFWSSQYLFHIELYLWFCRSCSSADLVFLLSTVG